MQDLLAAFSANIILPFQLKKKEITVYLNIYETKLTEKKDAAGDYTLTYGANLTAGKNKGTVTVSGAGKYGGSITVRFDILSRNIYEAP